MLLKRIVPCLSLNNGDLVHRISFQNKAERYIGDPINAVNIFNQYEVDEMFILDITASQQQKKINFELLKDLAEEAFFPLAYGGGIKSPEEAEKIISIGYEKIIINSQIINNLNLLNNCKNKIGGQSVIASIDFIKKKNKYFIYDYINKKPLENNIGSFIKNIIDIGIGEMIITSVNLDGTMQGCDLNLIELIQDDFQIPLIYKGGASSHQDIKKVLSTKVNAFSSSTIFIMKKINEE